MSSNWERSSSRERVSATSGCPGARVRGFSIESQPVRNRKNAHTLPVPTARRIRSIRQPSHRRAFPAEALCRRRTIIRGWDGAQEWSVCGESPSGDGLGPRQIPLTDPDPRPRRIADHEKTSARRTPEASVDGDEATGSQAAGAVEVLAHDELLRVLVRHDTWGNPRAKHSGGVRGRHSPGAFWGCDVANGGAHRSE